ncbi:unnamed protein product [Prorocentrum cordatum]|uniref:Uncharacterized protein n=1 Tax=Prorocentrum cordatum TaxID=2364126 RepID=A0ABN9UBB7_9DINO|nr:unnamed protein product [Polarella glacialis]
MTTDCRKPCDLGHDAALAQGVAPPSASRAGEQDGGGRRVGLPACEMTVSAPLPLGEATDQASEREPHRAPQAYLVDNRALRASTQGLGYRKSKDLDDKDGEKLAEWFTTVEGVEESGGWIRVGDRFLPLQLNGVTVMTLQESAADAPTVPPASRCPMGHELLPVQAKPGRCDSCGKDVIEGESVQECGTCNWCPSLG